MKKEKIIEIWKKLIHLAWTNSKWIRNDKKLLEQIESYESELGWDKTKYSNVILWFIKDLKSDLLAWRELNIDSIDSDEYLENYFITKNEVQIFNNLIPKKEYRLLFDKKTKNHNEIYQIIEKQFLKQLKSLNSKNIAKNLLIFTLFNKDKPLDWLSRIKLISSKINLDIAKINKLIILYKNFIKQVYVDWVTFYKKEQFNYKFIKFSWDNIDSKSKDASKVWFRSWNANFEFKQLLIRLKKD